MLNADGATWAKQAYEPRTIYQLDRFHIEQAITRCIRRKDIRRQLHIYLKENRIDELLDYLDAYRNSVSDVEYKSADKLYSYLYNNKDGLIPYMDRGIDIPEPPDGIEYKNLGTQENHNYTIITSRMKHRRMSWSVSGANNMARILAERENDNLCEIISAVYSKEDDMSAAISYTNPTILTAAQTPEYDGNGYMPKLAHMPLYDWNQLGSTSNTATF